MKVYSAINKVQADLARDGISKDRKNAQQGYNFRGIDDMYNALAPVLSKHGLCVLPRVKSRECVERMSAKGAALLYVTVEVDFDFVAAEDGSKHTITTYGEAMDSGDKATNKAMSAAYKYAAMQAFAIPTEGDNDADAHTHQVAPMPKVTPTSGLWEQLNHEEQAFLQGIANEVTRLIAADDTAAAASYINDQRLGADEKAALWTRFNSAERSALKKLNELKKAA